MKQRNTLAQFSKLAFITAIATVTLGCGKAAQSNIPYVAVNFSALLTDPRLAKLGSPGGAVLISGYGVAGLVIYREADGSYAAYDRCSTYEPDKRCAVTLDSPAYTVTDPCSGSKFSLTDGSPVKAPATLSLKSYSVSTSNNEIYVTN
jgi:nitrite reductase/ring-hydroxylating ferredoxin subunit